MTDAELVNAAVWRMGRRGVLEMQERLERVGFVVGHGVILLPAPGFMVEGRVEDGALHVPDEGEQSVGIQLEVRLLPEGGEPGSAGEHARLLDRWEAYHGRRGAARFAIAAAEGARLGGAVVDGEDLELVNTLGNEGALLRKLNADRAALQRAVSRRLGVEIADPTAVGIDQRGVDVRTRTGVLRLSAAKGARLDDAGAGAFVNDLLSTGEGARA